MLNTRDTYSPETFTVTLDSGYVIDTVVFDNNDDPNINGYLGTISDTAFEVYPGAGAINGTLTITSKVPPVKQTIDISKLTGWADLSSGDHNITIKTKASGYLDSSSSNAITVNKAASGYSVTFLSGGDFSRANVYDGQSATGSYTSLQTSSDTVVTCTSGYLYLVGAGYGTDSGVYAPTVTGGVTVDSIDPETSGSGIGDAWILFKVTSDGTVGAISISCFIEGTQITLADRTTKAIEDITYDDELLVWNFYAGRFDKAKPTWIKIAEIAPRYNLVKFSNGSEVGFVGAGGEKGYHRIFNKEAGAFTYTGNFKETPNGTTTFAQDGTFPTVISQEVVEKEVKFYNVITDKHYNLFANGILTSCKLSNKYHIENMRYIGEKLISDEQEKAYFERIENKRK